MEAKLATTTSSTPQVFNFFNPEHFETMQRVCKMFANSELVPDMYKISKDNPEAKAVANCMIAVEIATRIGASPLMVMQNMTPIYGKPSWSSKFLIATVNSCGRFEALMFKFINLGKVGKVNYTEYVWENSKKVQKIREFDGTNVDNLECIAFTNSKGNNVILESSPVSILMAIKEGWYTKNGSKWPTMTRQMLTYRSASFWTSAYAPELSMGMKTVEEIRDIEDAECEVITDKKTRDNAIQELANSQEIPIQEIAEELIPDKKTEEVKSDPKQEDIAF